MIPSMPQNKKLQTQSGNVFIIILIGIILFAALLYTFTNSTRTGTGNLSAQQSMIAAQEILNYARLVEGAVNRLRQNGCSENEISFDNTAVSGYENTDAPIDNSCHVFNPAGGAITNIIPPDTYFDSLNSADPVYGSYTYTDNSTIFNIGSTKQEATVLLNFIDKDICMKINNLLNISNPSNSPPIDIGTMNFDSLYDGNFPNSPSSSFNAPEIIGRNSGCISDSSETTFHFYHVLFAR